jgi:ribosomal-protein-alanine N-acetyltransferase
MNGRFDIRPATLTLAAALAHIHRESFGTEGWSLEQMRGSLSLDTTIGWIACENGTPLGFILYQTVGDESEILTFCVRPERQRQRIGESLLRHAISTAHETGAKHFRLEVAADNHPARQLYERLGFTIAGIRPNYYKRGAVTVDALMYKLAAIP